MLNVYVRDHYQGLKHLNWGFVTNIWQFLALMVPGKT